jgi:iron complex transport system ATP-binding protein
MRWRDITLSKNGTAILEEVSLSAARGEVLGLIGPNGAGKTALLRCAAGLEGRAFGHKVEIGGVPANHLSPSQRARAVAYLPQQGETAWPITASAAVALGRLPHGGKSAVEDSRAVARALDAVGMTDFSQRPLSSLSGGERALILLARVLAVESDVLLLDEPAAALDPHHQLATMALLRRLASTVFVIASRSSATAAWWRREPRRAC